MTSLGALIQAKIDIERIYDNQSLYSLSRSHQNSVDNRANRLFFVLLGILLVASIFGLTVLFFQRMYVEIIKEIFSIILYLIVVAVIVIQNYLKLHEYVNQHTMNR